MTLKDLFSDKTLKQKDKSAFLRDGLSTGKISTKELVAYAEKANDVEIATCIESMEYVSKKKPTLIDESCLPFLNKSLANDSPRVKWESARVIGNIAKVYPTKIKSSIKGLLDNTWNDGTVVRWATAYALAEILKLKLPLNKELLPAIENICEKEQDNGVRKKYQDALKKVKPG